MVPRVLVFDNATGSATAGRRDRHPDEAVLAVLRALRLRDEVLQPLFRLGEGKHGERGRFPAPQPDGADAVRGGMGPAHGRVVGTLRRDRARRPLPRGRADPGPVRDGPRPHAPAAAVHVRRVRLARVKADRTGTVTIDSNRYLAGPKWHSMRLMAGVRALRVELRSMDGEPIVTLERRWGRSPDTAMDPLSLLAIIARKPRSWGESPIRSDFPEETRVLLDRMEPRERGLLVDDIRHAAVVSGFRAAVMAVVEIVAAGRRPDRAAIDQTARRIAQGDGPESRARLDTYSRFMREDGDGESTDAAAGGRRGGRTVSKSTPDEVMELACGLPLTRSVLRSVLAGATPGQLGVLADLFRAENASRTESRRARLIRNAGFPCVKGLRRIRLGHGVVPRRLGARAAHGPRFRGPGRGPRALRRRGMRQDAHGDRHGHAGVREGACR